MRISWRRTTVLVLLAVVPAFAVSSNAQQAEDQKKAITILPLPAKNVSPSIQDVVYAAIAKELRTRYSAKVLSGRAVSRAVWGTLASGLEEASMRFTSSVAEGKRAYQQLQIPQTLNLLKTAKVYEDLCGPEIREPNIFGDLHVYTALAQFAKGDLEQAGAEFRQAVSHNPELNLSTDQFPPDVVEAFGKAKKQLLAQKTSQVEIVSRPDGATVYLDGIKRGVTPLKGLPLYPGHHYIRLELEGFSPWTMNVPEGGAPGLVNAMLVPLWSGDPPEGLLNSAIAVERLDESVMAEMRLLASFFKADALLLLLLSQRGQNYTLGTRLFLVQPELVTRTRIFNLGSDASTFDQKSQGVVSTLTTLQKMGGKTVATNTQTGSGGNSQAFELKPAKPDEGKKPPSTGPGTAWYKSWWFWTAVGAVVVGTATGVTIWALSSSEADSWSLIIRPN